ncbi:MAG: hypothetical protein OEW78_00435 [Nitrosopumilus sp.]|uniref:hypothetical protein n=1 Tax=Nitrosopumilus sp. TaxID=2024843 RepID=UPI002471857E|nr:hypothetical protein [Nitrosopumilus sp.]MDH5430337.1 hypothetical protein [Nitrosopumilus sp.]MDH5665868.1 hypothetical protein [Nitrosopumilus sp.]MDH5697806.1 hypothetical protein [Nitrosopumilus sp.]
MSLKEEINKISKDFENTSSEKLIDVLNQIKPHFKNELIPEYLQAKIQKIQASTDEPEKKKQCKALLPYFDWYLQGL